MMPQGQVLGSRPARAAAPPGRGYPAAALALPGVCLAIYTAIRPFSDKSTLRGSRTGGRARAGLVFTAPGTRLTLPYYGAENFGPSPARVTLYGYTGRSSASSIATVL